MTAPSALRAAKAQREGAVSRRMVAARGAVARYSALDADRRAAEAAIDALNAKVSTIREQVAAQRTKYESGIGGYSPIINGELVLLARLAREQARRAAQTFKASSWRGVVATRSELDLSNEVAAVPAALLAWLLDS